MITVLRTSGLSVVIFLDDHEPAHVHVFGDGEAKIELLGQGGVPRLVWARGMTRAEIRRAMQIVTLHRDALLQRWMEIHG
ncbi:MAG: DUF4160 domain-containing protein [Caulobacter sp.]